MLFLLAGVSGWVIGAILGTLVGVGVDLVFLADQPSGPGATVVSVVWGTALIGGIIGSIGAIAWLATRMGRARN